MQHLITYHLNPPTRIGFLYYGLRPLLVFFFWNLHLPLNSEGNCTCTCEILLSVGLSFCFWPLGGVSRVLSEPLLRSLFLQIPLLHSPVLSCWPPRAAAFPPSAPWGTAARRGCRRAGRGRGRPSTHRCLCTQCCPWRPLTCAYCVAFALCLCWYLVHFLLCWPPWRAESEFSEILLFSQFEVIRFVFCGVFFPLQIINPW